MNNVNPRVELEIPPTPPNVGVPNPHTQNREDIPQVNLNNPVVPQLDAFTKFVFCAGGFCMLLSLGFIVAGCCIPWFYDTERQIYAKDNFLWIFILVPCVSIVGSLKFVVKPFETSLFLKIWGLSTLTMVFPALIMFLCFSTTFVYMKDVKIEWELGSFFILGGHLMVVCAAILFVKF
eukprot:TRINITY_DN5914_c0_g3_i1.p1 TRINITY_DN5914_c0_g3~~TRINITY_DN5914_c0_g3_i1.p1  ORF type:complete len:178 (-),score=35.01 TRINITY_DN5914_c0_g3_i1:26-559(-)